MVITAADKVLVVQRVSVERTKGLFRELGVGSDFETQVMVHKQCETSLTWTPPHLDGMHRVVSLQIVIQNGSQTSSRYSSCAVVLLDINATGRCRLDTRTTQGRCVGQK